MPFDASLLGPPISTGISTGGFDPSKLGPAIEPPRPAIGSQGTVVGGVVGNYLQNLVKDYQTAGEEIIQSPQDAARLYGEGHPITGLLRAGIGTASAFGRAVFAPITEAAKAATEAVGIPSEGYLGSAAQGAAGGAALAGAPGALVGGLYGLGIHGLEQVKQLIYDNPAVKPYLDANPNVKRNIDDGFNLAYIVAGEKLAAGKGMSEEINPARMAKEIKTDVQAIVKAPKNLYEALTSKSPEQLDQFILKQFEKGVKPSVAGKGTLAQQQLVNQRSIRAVKLIADNKPNLSVTDEFGEPTSKLPETNQQFAQAVEQTKARVFEQYNAQKIKAGEKGAIVPLGDTVKELRAVTTNPSIEDLRPEVARYATKRADMLEKRGQYSPDQAQEAIKVLNKSLEAFYRQPSYDTASRATVDAMIVNRLRKGLDDSIESATGEDYQKSKNDYGALRSIEKDVVHRANIEARKNAKGLIDFTDIISAADIAKGIVTFSPGEIVRGSVLRAVKEYYKSINSPDANIKRLFEGVEKYYLKTLSSPKSSTPPVPEQDLQKIQASLPTLPKSSEKSSRLKETGATSKEKIAELDRLARGDVKNRMTDSVELTKIFTPLDKSNSIPVLLNKQNYDLINLKRDGNLNHKNLVDTAENYTQGFLTKKVGQPDKINLVKLNTDGSVFVIGANRFNGYGAITYFEQIDTRKSKNYLESLKMRGESFNKVGGTASRLTDGRHPSSIAPEGGVPASLSGVNPDNTRITKSFTKVKGQMKRKK